MQCTFQSLSHIAKHISSTVEHKYSLLWTILVAACGAIGLDKKEQVVFENAESFLSWLVVTDVLEEAPGRR